MSTEPMTSTAAPADAAASERGLLVTMLLLVLLGSGAMLLMS